jgi:MinD-like ATPase involved in chromosome partitioning or flagellar assembly
MTDVITGLGPAWESVVATTLESAADLRVTRRCADVAELLSVAEAGLGQCAVVSADLHGLDLGLVHRLRQRGVLVLGLYPTGDDRAERRLRQLRIPVVLPVEATAEAFSAAVRDQTEGRPNGRPRPTDLPLAGPADGMGQLLVPDHVPDDLVDTGRATGGYSMTPAGFDPSLPSGTSVSDDDDGHGWQPRGAERGAAPSTDADPTTRFTVVAVWGPTGGPGRTTLAVNLAAELASRSQEVLLVDADTYGGSVAQVLGLLDEAPGLAAACRAADQGTLDLPALARLAPLVMPGLRVLTGLPKAERWPELRAAALERVLELGRGLAHVIVVDCGFCIENDEELSYDTAAPRRNEATLTTLAEADAVLAVGSADPVGLQRFVRALQELGSLPSPSPVPVINRVRSSAVGSRPEERIAESLLRFAGLGGLHFVPDDAATVDAALLAGRSVVEHAPDSPLRAAFAELATAVAPWTQTRVTGRQRRPRRARAAG